MCEIQEYQKIIDDLNGSSESLANHLARIDREELQDVEAFTDMLDDQLFECAACGWWCEQAEAQASDDGDVCNDCS